MSRYRRSPPDLRLVRSILPTRSARVSTLGFICWMAAFLLLSGACGDAAATACEVNALPASPTDNLGGGSQRPRLSGDLSSARTNGGAGLAPLLDVKCGCRDFRLVNFPWLPGSEDRTSGGPSKHRICLDYTHRAVLPPGCAATSIDSSGSAPGVEGVEEVEGSLNYSFGPGDDFGGGPLSVN